MRFFQLPSLFAVMMSATAVLSQTAPTSSTPVKPMAADARPSFAVAVIKPHDPASQRQGFDAEGDRLTIRNESVANLLSFAYSAHPRQIVDAPDSLFHDRYDIEGTTDAAGEPSLLQQQEMVQQLLADRFGLKFHHERRELPVYAIQVVKGGAKLKRAANPSAQPDQEGNGRGTEQTITYTSSSIGDFIMGEQFFVDRPLVDQTGLTGRYDFSIHYTFDEARTTDPNAPPGLFTAVQEQLGLRLQPTKASTDVFVIDHVDKPW
jgi:uncharacterized protein (TIGR03435 family)